MRLAPVIAISLIASTVSATRGEPELSRMDVTVSFPLDREDNSGVEFTSKSIEKGIDSAAVRLAPGSNLTVVLTNNYRDFGEWLQVASLSGCLELESRVVDFKKFTDRYRTKSGEACVEDLHYVRVTRNTVWDGKSTPNLTILIKAQVGKKVIVMKCISVIAMMLGVIGVSGGKDVKISFPLKDRDNSGVEFTSKSTHGDDDSVGVKLTQGSTLTVVLNDSYRCPCQWTQVVTLKGCLELQSRESAHNGRDMTVTYRYIATSACVENLHFVNMLLYPKCKGQKDPSDITVLVKVDVEKL